MNGVVLYIDDNQDNILVVQRLLKRSPDIQLRTAMTGRDGIRAAIDDQPALILLDNRLPDTNGEQVLRELAATPATAAIPVVILSGDSGRVTVNELLAAGAADFLAKPFDLNQLLAIIGRYLGLSPRDNGAAPGQDASMDIRAVAFDANGTLVRILTEDGMEEIFRAAGHFLTYQGIDLCRDQVRDLYFTIMAEQQQASRQEHPEFDAVGIWRRIITEHQTAFTRALPAAKLEQMPLFLAEMCRGISRRRLGLYPHAREVLDALRERYPLALVTDAQSAYARAELHRVGLLGYFDPIVVSGDHGYRKPDRRLFQAALDGMDVAAGNAMYVGNDMHRDIFGAREAGLTTVMFDSDQGKKAYRDCVPDYTITDLRDLLQILGV